MKNICKKCNAPIVVENNKLICCVCKEEYGDFTSEKIERNDIFFENISLQKFFKLNQMIRESVAVHWGQHEMSKNTTWGDPVYTVATMSNGKYYAKFVPGVGFHKNYRGQVDVENWIGVEKIYADPEFCVGITETGELRPTLIEVEDYINELKSLGISDMKIKEICVLDISKKCFLGVDIEGNIVIHNPIEIFDLEFYLNSEEERNESIGHIVQEITQWKQIKHLYKSNSCIAGVTENGEVYTAKTTSDMDNSAIKKLNNWKSIESICEYDQMGFSEFVGHKKDGTLCTTKENIRESIERASNVVQLSRYASGKYTILFKNGNLMYGDTLIADDVIAFIDCGYDGISGYIKTDGTLYEQKALNTNCIVEKDYFEKVEGLKLFESVVSIEKEWEDKKSFIKESKLVLENNIETKEKYYKKLKTEIAEIEEKISKLSFFNKEKKILKNKLYEMRELIEKTYIELNGLKKNLDLYKKSCARWKKVVEHTNDNNITKEQVMTQHRQAYTPAPKSTSVIKSAAIGGVIAGPTGAIVGAIYALDKNNKK